MEVFTHEVGGPPNADGDPAGKKRAFMKEFLYKNMDFIALAIMLLLFVGIMLGLIT